MKKLIILALLAGSLFTCQQQSSNSKSSANTAQADSRMEFPRNVEFPSLDSLMISARLYQIDTTSPFILLCHQARFNKFEYSGIAERLNQLGFNCMAIDQRSGGPIGKMQNETYLRAFKAGKSVDYLDAEQDMRAAVKYIAKNYSDRVILWGSSYSSTLALYLAVDMDEVSAVISFSPGNYLAEAKGSLIDRLEHFGKPMFLTSSKSEAKYVKALLEKHTLGEQQVQFIPQGAGHHGSRALWINQQGGEEYWEAITRFLSNIK